MNTRQDWPLGPALRSHREARGLSVKAAARRTNKKVSDGRWYQLESGYQQIKGQRIPISTTAATVAAAAAAVDWDVTEALKLAGFDPVDVPAPSSALDDVSTADIIDEIRVLFAEVRRRVAANDSVVIDGQSTRSVVSANDAQELADWGRGFGPPSAGDGAAVSGDQ